MKKLLFIIIGCFFLATAFAQIEKEKFQEVSLQGSRANYESLSKDSSVSSIPPCFCCDGAFNLSKPVISGKIDNLKCGEKYAYSINQCRGASINWSITPSVPFSGNSTNCISVAFPSSTTSGYVITVTVRCGNKSISSSIKVQPCKQERKTVEITTGSDAVIHCLDSKVKTNFGNVKMNLISNWTFQGTPAIISSVLQFNLPSDLTSTSIIHSATLYLYDYCDPSDGGANLYTYPATHGTSSNTGFYVKRITSPWNENSVSCAAAPTSVATNQVTVNAVTLPGYTQGMDNLSIAVGTLLQQMATAGNYGFLLEFQDTNITHQYRARSYGSFNNANPSLRPKLVISYTP